MTDSLREWAMGVCALSVFCAAVNILIPKERCGRIIELGLSALMILVVISPLTQLRGFTVERKPVQADTSRQEELETLINAQAAHAVENAARMAVEQRLNESGIKAQEITVSTDIAENGSISIGQIAVSLDAGTSIPPASVRILLEEWSGMKNVEVICTGGSDG